MVDPTIEIDRERSVLLVVDIQPDFLPGGALPVERGSEILEPVRALLEAELFPLCVATQDWHPPDHISFASHHPGRKPFDTIELYGHEQTLWPDHCIQGTPGAELSPDIDWRKATAVVRKATDPRVDSYSAFRNNWDPEGRRPPTGLAGYLRERGVDHVWICGLARDYCVKWSGEDARDAGFDVTVLWDLTRAIDPGADEHVRKALEEKGARIVESDRLSINK